VSLYKASESFDLLLQLTNITSMVRESKNGSHMEKDYVPRCHAHARHVLTFVNLPIALLATDFKGAFFTEIYNSMLFS
jgi:hypothetical protein